MKEDCNRTITLENVLAFTTAASRVPPMGFNSLVKVFFVDELFPRSNSCSLHFYLPLKWNDSSEFKSNMIEELSVAMTLAFIDLLMDVLLF